MAKKKQYTVHAGDNPARIAERLYGDQRYFNVIMDALKGIGGQTLRAGQVLSLPDLEAYQKKLRREGGIHEVTQGDWQEALFFTGEGRLPGRGEALGASWKQEADAAAAAFAPPPLNLPLPPGVISGATPAPLPSTVVGPYDPADPALLNLPAPAPSRGETRGSGVPPYGQVPPPSSFFLLPLSIQFAFGGLSYLLNSPGSRGRGSAARGVRLPARGGGGGSSGFGYAESGGGGSSGFGSGIVGGGGVSGFGPPGRGANSRLSQPPGDQNVAGRLTGNTVHPDMLEQKPANTYQVQRGVYTPILDAQGRVIGWNMAQTGELINVPGKGGKPGEYVGQGYQGRVIGGTKDYPDLQTPQKARDYVQQKSYPKPAASGGGGGGGYPGGDGGGGGGGGGYPAAPSHGATSAPQMPFIGGAQDPQQQFSRQPSLPSRYLAPSGGNYSTQPQGGRTPFISPANPARVGLVTWRI